MGRLKNVRATKVKLSKVKALKFKRAANKSKMDVDVVEEHLSNMDPDKVVKKSLRKPNPNSKKRLLRKHKKEELRKAVAAKRIKSLVAAPDAMEGALPPTDKIEGPTEPKIKEDRVRQSELPIQLALKKRQRKVQAKELASSNVVTGRRMSKKKARKLMNAMERDKRELERKAAAMDLA